MFRAFREHLGHDILYSRLVAHLIALRLDSGGGVHEGLALGENFHQHPVDPVDLITDVRHGLGGLGGVAAGI